MTKLVAIVGRPNVGKSTLFNRLVGFQKAIVDDQPGVTRDRNYAVVELEDRTVTLVDTGGFDPDDQNGMMAQVREQTLLAVEEADLTVLLADGKHGLSPHDRDLVDLLRRSGRPFLVAVNKIDSPEKEMALAEFHEIGVEPILPVSAAHGYGVNNLLEHIAALLPEGKDPYIPDDMIRVAVIGRPNVGKSSLVNRLVGEPRTLVTDQPGTTRDPVDTEIVRKGRRYLFVDTAGIRRKGRVSAKVEKYAVMRALRSVERCDVALLLIDSVEGLTDQDAHVAGYAVERGRCLVLLFNKWDLVKNKNEAQKEIKARLDLKLRFLSFTPWLTGSALTGLRVDRIFDEIESVFSQYTFRAPTAQVNKILEDAVEAHPPAYSGRGRLKFFYATQAGAKPPTFVVFSNKPEEIHFSYQRYLTNTFREAFGLNKIPIKVKFKPRSKKD
ncbi:MAG: ribosome biogenesis GTPase Der [Pseudomonadota bacterium]